MCGSGEERTPGTGKCASSACAAHLDSWTDNVELIAAGLASCTGEFAGLAQYANVERLKSSVKGLADECGLTPPAAPPAAPPPGFDTCIGAKYANPTYVFDLPCGPYESRTPGTGKCASTACADLVDSFTDAKVKQMAAGFASCTDTEQGVLKYAGFGVDSLKNTIRHYVSPCGLTAPFTPLRFDTCIRAKAYISGYETKSVCGSEGERTPGTGKCASSACAAHLDSLSDNVELMAAGLDSCTGEDAGLAQYGDVKKLKRSIKGLADECGHTLASAQTAEDTGTNVVAIVGGAVGGVAALAVVIGVVVYLKKKAQATKPPVAGVEVQSVKADHI